MICSVDFERSMIYDYGLRCEGHWQMFLVLKVVDLTFESMFFCICGVYLVFAVLYLVF